MHEVVRYCCESCGESFSTSSECISHEILVCNIICKGVLVNIPYEGEDIYYLNGLDLNSILRYLVGKNIEIKVL